MNDVNDGYVVEDLSMNEIEKYNVEIIENVENEVVESE